MYSDQDPRSWNYVRTYTRPPLHPVRVAGGLLLIGLLYAAGIKLTGSVWPGLLTIAFFLVLQRKSIVVWFVKCYQHFAPIRVRSMCRYEPSCSEYMIRAVEKYGVVKGIQKGLDRINRCMHLGGGFDDP